MLVQWGSCVQILLLCRRKIVWKVVRNMDTPEILFQYLKDVIYNTDKANLNLEQLPEDFQKLGQGLQLFGQWVKEAKRFSMAIAKGDLSYNEGNRENVFIAPMKDLQGTLRHLAWQTQQVAKGDYSQNVEFMGEFSDAFNTMTKQLKERREALIAEKKQVERKNEELERSFELIMAFANYTHSMIFIHSADGKRELFRNEFARCFLESKPDTGENLLAKLRVKDREKIESTDMWEMEIYSEEAGKDGEYFSIESYPIMWRQQKALVHVVVDDTERKCREKLMYELVYVDPLTGLYNRRYAMEQMHKWMEKGISFVISFIDVDYLKYCNDTQGHKSGDIYLLEVSKALAVLDGVHCRTGGDEFMIIQTGKTPEERDRELEKVRATVERAGRDKPFPQSFSYASCEVLPYPQKSLEEYLIMVDSLMYQYKAAHRKPLEDINYQDDRNWKNW